MIYSTKNVFLANKNYLIASEFEIALQLLRFVKKSIIAFFVGAPSSIIIACSMSAKQEHLRSVSMLRKSSLMRSFRMSEYIERTYIKSKDPI